MPFAMPFAAARRLAGDRRLLRHAEASARGTLTPSGYASRGSARPAAAIRPRV